MRMVGLRERQKEDRRNRILRAAHTLFAKSGYERTTIEAIAEAAQVSGVTVHNYYGTKSNVLLALVTDSDRKLVARIDEELSGTVPGLRDLVLRFAAVIREHALANLDKPLWRQVIAAAVTEAASPFGRAYHALDHQLAMALVARVEALQERGAVGPEARAYDLGKALFHIQNTRFIQYISVPEMTDGEAHRKLQADLDALLAI
jgi:AcrR family transcriptional regulator